MNIWKNEKPEEKKTSSLSSAASSYLEELRKKFSNIDFIIADYANDEEAQRLLKQGKGEYNCLITPALLEEMAANEEIRSKYEEIIGNAVTQVKELKEEIGEKSEMVENYGFSVDGDGNVNYYVLLRDGLPKDLNGGSKIVKASSIEELMKRLDEIDEERRTEKQYENRKEWVRQFKDGFGKDKDITAILKSDIERKIRVKDSSRNEDGDVDFEA
jgi:hypothetical protein